MVFDPDKPYNELPLLPPKQELETPTVLKKALGSARALAELRGMGKTIPDQNIFINSLTLQEAKDSSAIENVITTNDALFKAFLAQSSQIDPATKEVLRCHESLWEGFNTLKKRGLPDNMCIEYPCPKVMVIISVLMTMFLKIQSLNAHVYASKKTYPFFGVLGIRLKNMFLADMR